MGSGSKVGTIGGVVILIVIVLGLFSCASSCGDGSSSRSSTSRSSSSGNRAYYDESTGNTLYTYGDGSREYTDGFGNVVRDSDGDGKVDKASVDGGETWFNY